MINILDINSDNVDQYGFFCMRSKRKSEGYQRKQNWLKQRFQEGLKLKIIRNDDFPMGFIEYIPSEYAWRAIKAENYFVIHCLWILGGNKGKGYGTKLLDQCIEDARNEGKSGVAMVTSSKNWLADKSLFIKFGFESVDSAPPFELIVKKLNDSPLPKFTGDWENRIRNYQSGLTVLFSDQCPYIYAAVKALQETAEELEIPFTSIEMQDCKDA